MLAVGSGDDDRGICRRVGDGVAGAAVEPELGADPSWPGHVDRRRATDRAGGAHGRRPGGPVDRLERIAQRRPAQDREPLIWKRIAASRRMTSPLKYGLSTIAIAMRAYSSGWPMRLGNGTAGPHSASIASSDWP